MNKIFPGIVSIVIFGVLFLLIGQEYHCAQGKVFHFSENNLAQKAKTATLNHRIPDFTGFAHYIESGRAIDPDSLVKYILYYQTLVEFSPQSPEAYELLGFCYYFQGSTDKAARAYQKAIEINPYYFWSYYNLGLLAYKERKFQLAANLLNKAVALNPELILKIIATSKIYNQILSSVGDHEGTMKSSIPQGYRDSYRLITASYYYSGKKELGAKESAKDFERLNTLSLKIF